MSRSAGHGARRDGYVAIVMLSSILLNFVWWYASFNGLVSSAMKPGNVKAQHRRLILVTLIVLVAGCVAPCFPPFAIDAMPIAIRYIIVTAGTRRLVD